MKRKIISRLLAAALCLALAGCGSKGGEPAPAPAPGSAASPQDTVQPGAAQDPQPVEPVPPEAAGGIADSCVGTWRDGPQGTSGGRCSMEIACGDGVHYDIYIYWGCSSATARYWNLTGTYDETQAGIAYTGIQFYGTTLSDGTVERSEETEDEEGLIRLEDGVLLWEDTVKHKGEGMAFIREA